MTLNTESLLDRLYNLRGSDSDILKEMDRQKAKAEETKARTTEEKGKLQTDISDMKKLREELQDQGEKFKETLQGIHKEDYETVLSRLRIDFDPQSILDKLERNLPKTIETVERDTKKAEDELVKVEDEMNEAITTIEELGIRRDAAIANQEKLNEYFDLALSGHINITRDSITSLLEEFGFNEEEQRETAKILMFPEDALLKYNERVEAKEKSGKSISEVIQEAKTMVEDEPTFASEEQVQDSELHEVQNLEEPEENIVEEPVLEGPDVTEEALEVLKEEGIDYLDFTSDEVNDLLEHFDRNVVVGNIRYLNSKGIANDVFVNHIGLMYDAELRDKVELILSLGKEPMDIYLNPNILVKYNLEELNEAIERVRGTGIDPKELPLMVY